MNREKVFLGILILVLIVLNYGFIEGVLVENFGDVGRVEVERVVDGDTVIVEGNSMRLLGINTPERGEIGYSEAKEFLEDLVLDKEIKIEKFGQDIYYRDLVYLFDGKKNINLEIVLNGYGNYYFPEGKENYYDDFVSAWEECLNSGKNLCEKSSLSYAGCVVLEKFDYRHQKVVLKNVCNFDVDLTGWEIKDEGRKKFVFGNFVLESFGEVEITEEDFEKDYVWTSSGDTLFLRDNFGKLVLWEGY